MKELIAVALSAQKVVAILKQAGFPHAGPVRYSQEHSGYTCQREGFRTWHKDGRVSVEHWFVDPSPDNYREILATKIMAYKSVLESAGLTGRVYEIGGRPFWLEVS